MKNIIFIAPPAAGKGTQSEMLKEKYGYVHISTGDLLREAITSGTEFGLVVKNIIDSGNLVDDCTMINLIEESIEKVKGKPFILDGFPRTLTQAKALDTLLTDNAINYVVIYLNLNYQTAKERILGRLTCICGKSYNIYDEKLIPKKENTCDYCGKKLIKRDDDNEASFEIRYKSFIENNEPILKYYKELNNLIYIDVNKNIKDIFNDIIEVVIND